MRSNGSPVRPSNRVDLARRVEPGLLQHRADVRLAGAVEHRRAHRDAGGQVRRQLHHRVVVAGVDVLGVTVAVDVLELGADRLDVLAGDVLAALVDAVEHLLDLLAEAARGPAEVGLEDLPDVHPDRHAERVEHDVGMGPVLEERHVLDRQDAADDALVAVTAGHLVARLQLALHRDEHLDHLEHARRQLVAALELLDAVLEAAVDDVRRPRHTGP